MPAKTEARNAAAAAANVIPVAKKIIVHPHNVVKREDDRFALNTISIPDPTDRKNPLVLAAIQAFKKITFEADDADTAAAKMTIALEKTLKVSKPNRNAAKQPETPPAAEQPPKAPSEQQSAEKPPAATPEAQASAKNKNKDIALFSHFCEFSKARCLPLSPDNEKIVKQALRYFDCLAKTSKQETKLSAAEQNILQSEEYFKAVRQLCNRNSMRLLLTEYDKQKNVVSQLLLNPLYVNPLSILCVIEAHNAPQPKKSVYVPHVVSDALNYELTSYDSFQFHPHQKDSFYTTTTTNSKLTNTVEFQFVNVVLADRD